MALADPVTGNGEVEWAAARRPVVVGPPQIRASGERASLTACAAGGMPDHSGSGVRPDFLNGWLPESYGWRPPAIC